MQSSTKISSILSITISFFNFLVIYVILEQSFFESLYVSLTFLIFTFIIIKYSFRKFIKNRIKPIFKTIYEVEKTGQEIDSLDQIEKDALKLQKKRNLNISNLKKQIDFKKEFLGNVSHELKTPLFSIQGYIDTLIDGGLKDENINIAYLKKASRNIERLSSIVADIDVISKIESSALKLNYKSFYIDDLIKDVIEDLELLADKNEILVYLDGNQNHINVFADRERIKEVLINLISNSLKYGKENGTTEINIFDIEDKILVRISDNGLGIKKEQLPRIFERFYRLDSSRSREQGGSGLGLAIVKHIIEAHNQTINVRSVFGIGSTFEFTLKKA